MHSKFNRAEALAWYVKGFDLITIAQHYGMTVEALKTAIRTE